MIAGWSWRITPAVRLDNPATPQTVWQLHSASSISYRIAVGPQEGCQASIIRTTV
tara:strand:+ start:4005 stop:4169 length:165 start_codon:yes stop_codon:yes gene_type:complete